MKKEYDFSESIKTPYIKKLKKQISIRIEKETVEIDIPYQNLMNIYLRECAENNKKPNIHWQ
ncbi:MAG: antitoxin [Ignavibacteria bacterium]